MEITEHHHEVSWRSVSAAISQSEMLGISFQHMYTELISLICVEVFGARDLRQETFCVAQVVFGCHDVELIEEKW